MRPGTGTGAHRTPHLAELVCSNSLKSNRPSTAHGLLKAEIRLLGSLLIEEADRAAIPAGEALAVDRDVFSRAVTARIESHPLIRVVREEAALPLPSPAPMTIVATGPLTSPALAEALAARLGRGGLSFYDAIAPTLEADSLDRGIVFLQDRYGPPGEGSYLNCPLSREEYLALVAALRAGRAVPPRPFEEEKVFEACMPVEVLAHRGERTLAFGPLRPVGLTDPRTGRRPFAAVQLRPENAARTLFGMVGFQTKLAHPEQERVFRLIPGLANARFARLGSIHRNTFLDAPALLDPYQRSAADPLLAFAGQITGVEGYTESVAGGLFAGVYAAAFLRGEVPPRPPAETMCGALLGALMFAPPGGFVPVNAQMGLLPPLESVPPPTHGRRRKQDRREAQAERALAAMGRYAEAIRR